MNNLDAKDDWLVDVTLLETGMKITKTLTFLDSSFKYTVFVLFRPQSSHLCLKVEASFPAYMIYDAISIITVNNIQGPAFSASIPLTFRFDYLHRVTDIETNLDINEMKNNGFIDGNFMSLFITLTSKPVSKYIFLQENNHRALDTIITEILYPHALTCKSLLDRNDIDYICSAAKRILLRDPMLLRLKSPLVIVGDLHGKFFDLIRIFVKLGFPDRTNYLFTGNYIGKGNDNLDVLYLLFSLKVKFPDNIFLVRGRHEVNSIYEQSEFKRECLLKDADFELIADVFNYLPLAAIISKKVLVTSSGISHSLINLDDINKVYRPFIFDSSHPLSELLFSCPNVNVGHYSDNKMPSSVYYGKCALNMFLKKYNLEFLIRSNEISSHGFAFPFGSNEKLLSFCSCTDIIDGNKACALIINKELTFSFWNFSGLTQQEVEEFQNTNFDHHLRL